MAVDEDVKAKRRVKIPLKVEINGGSVSSQEEDMDEKKTTKTVFSRVSISGRFQWVSQHWNWTDIKPVIKSAVCAWVAIVLLVIPKVEIFMGQVSSPLSLIHCQLLVDVVFRLAFSFS